MRDVVYVKYYDHFWRERDMEDLQTGLDDRVYLETVGVVIFEDKIQLVLLNDWGNAVDDIDSTATYHVVIKSCIVKRTRVGGVEVDI